MVLGLCRLLLRDPIEAEDATQQVFLAAHRSVLAGSGPRDAPSWLAAIARNECRARILARQGEPLELTELASDLPDPLAAAIRATDLQAIWAAISSLPRRQRRALLLREVGGLSYRELGRALGMTDSSVESLLFRARRHVRSLVAGAVPLALRDELTRLIPGFDPARASVAGRALSMPLTLKLAATAVSVGVVTTGAMRFPEKHSPLAMHTDHPKPAVSVSRPASPPVAPHVAVHSVAVRQKPVSHEAEHRSAHEEDRQLGASREREDPPREQQATVEPTEPAQAESQDTNSNQSSEVSGDGEASTGGD